MNAPHSDRVVDEASEIDDRTVTVDEADEADEADDRTVMVDETDETDDRTVMVDETDDRTVTVDEADDAGVLVDRRPPGRPSALAEPVLVPARPASSTGGRAQVPPNLWAPPASDDPENRPAPERYTPRPVPPAPPALTIPDGAAPLRQVAPRMPSVARSTRRLARIAVAVWAAVTLVSCAGAVLLVRLVLR